MRSWPPASASWRSPRRIRRSFERTAVGQDFVGVALKPASRSRSEILHEIISGRRVNDASSRQQPHMEPAPGRLGVAQKCLRARKRLTALKAGDGGLAGAHPGGQFGLGEACSQASLEQLGGNLELRSERVILGLDLGVGEQTSLEFLEWDCHVISFRISTRQGTVVYISFLR